MPPPSLTLTAAAAATDLLISLSLLLLLLLPHVCLSHSHSYCCCCFHRPRFAYQVTVAYVGAAGHSEQLLASPAGVAALTASEARQASIAITDYVGVGG